MKDVRLFVVATILATGIFAAVCYSKHAAPYSAADDPIYRAGVNADQMMRDANAIPVRIVP